MMSGLHIPEKYQPYLRIGTCSWKYDSWKGLVYDPEKKYRPYDYLPDYARYFNTVEIDQWFWSLFPQGAKLPDPRMVKAYADCVPDDFLFTVKVPNSITLTHYYTKQPSAYKEYANRPKKALADGKVTPDEERVLKSLAKFFNMSTQTMKQILEDEVKIFRQSHSKEA